MAQHLAPESVTVSLPDCELVRSQLDAFVDGELRAFDPVGRTLSAGIRLHLAACEPCACLEQQLRALRHALRSVGERERAAEIAPPSLRARVAALLASH